MSNKQSLSCEKYLLCFMFHYFKYSLHLFKPSTVLGLEYSVLTRSKLCLIDKSSQFCNTGIDEVAITCTFGHKLCKSLDVYRTYVYDKYACACSSMQV